MNMKLADTLVLVNSKYPYCGDLQQEDLLQVSTQTDVVMEKDAASAFIELMNDIDAWKQIVPVSGWRSIEEQRKIWDETIIEKGRDFTKRFVATPCCSEHQTGLAIDVGIIKEKMDFIRPAFPYSGVAQVFREAAPKYGFVERYPRGKENITGISHEPWHFRYVGIPHAELMTEKGFVLEEYHAFLTGVAV